MIIQVLIHSCTTVRQARGHTHKTQGKLEKKMRPRSLAHRRLTDCADGARWGRTESLAHCGKIAADKLPLASCSSCSSCCSAAISIARCGCSTERHSCDGFAAFRCVPAADESDTWPTTRRLSGRTVHNLQFEAREEAGEVDTRKVLCHCPRRVACHHLLAAELSAKPEVAMNVPAGGYNVQ